MRLLLRTIPLAALALGLTLAVAACGDDAATTGPVAAASPQPAPTTGASGSGAATDDVTYLTAVCTDVNDTVNPILNKIAADPSLLSDQKKLVAEATPALSDLSDKLSALHPPADLQPYHDQLLRRFKDVVAQAKSGQLKGIGDIGGVTRGATVPQDVKDRIRNVGNQIPECQQSLAFGSDFFG
jgi:hypothetical protein